MQRAGMQQTSCRPFAVNFNLARRPRSTRGKISSPDMTLTSTLAGGRGRQRQSRCSAARLSDVLKKKTRAAEMQALINKAPTGKTFCIF